MFLIGEDVDLFGGVFKICRGLVERFGAQRVRGTPISESAFVGLAAGAAMTGLRPIVELQYADFIFCAMDQVVNEAAKLHYMFNGQFVLPLVVRAVGGGGRQLGATDSQTPDAIFAHFPGLVVIAPGTPEDAKGLLKSAIRSNDPVLFIEHATLYQVRGEVPDGDYTIPIGKSKVQRPGKDVTIVTYSKMLEISTHGITGLAVAGEDRPPHWWDSWKGLQAGARLEFRWDRFSFALVDFWSYPQFPYADRLTTFSRNVDPSTGRPRRYGATGACTTGNEPSVCRAEAMRWRTRPSTTSSTPQSARRRSASTVVACALPWLSNRFPE